MQKYRKLTSVHSISGKWCLKLPNQPIKKRTEPKVSTLSPNDNGNWLINWFQSLSVKHSWSFFFCFSSFYFWKGKFKNFFLKILLHISHSILLVTLTSYILKMFCIFHIIFNHLWFYAQVKRNEVNVFNVKTTLTFFKSLTKSLSSFGDRLCQKWRTMFALPRSKLK